MLTDKRFALVFALICNMFLYGQSEKAIQLKSLYERKDIKVEETGNGVLKIEYSDKKIRYKIINDYPETQKGSYYDSTIFDLGTIDTSLYNDKYTFWQEVPLSNFSFNYIKAGDINGNGKIELYGIKKQPASTGYEATNVYELNSNGIFKPLYVYQLNPPQSYPAPHSVRNIYDIDSDGYPEVHIVHGFPDSIPGDLGYWVFHQEFYKKNSDTSLATDLSFKFVPYTFHEGQQLQDMTLGNFDGDGKTDLLFARWTMNNDIDFFEYNGTLNNFDSIFVSKLPEEFPYSASGFSIGDFDSDGNLEFVLGTGRGNVLMYENYGDNQYRFEWQGKIESYHAYVHTSTKDLDGNGKPEFWVLGDAFYNGTAITRVTLFESDGINSYKSVAKIDLIGVMSFDAGNMQAIDVDKDGEEEVMICIDGHVIILKFCGNPNRQQFELFFLKRLTPIFYGAVLQDLLGNGVEELMISKMEDWDSTYAAKLLSRLYKPNFSTSLFENSLLLPTEFQLYQNFPNPFNPKTIIKFNLPQTTDITLKIYNILGEEVRNLLGKEMIPGTHTAEWDGNNNSGELLPGGIYFIRLVAGEYIKTIKAVLLK